MTKFNNLADILKSQCELYSELADVMILEKEAVSRWKVEDTLELTKRKDTLLYKDKVLEEARRVLIKRISMETGLESPSLSNIIDLVEDSELRAELNRIRTELKDIVVRLNDANLSLKILYRTNITLVNDFFAKIGLTAEASYGSQTSRGVNSLVDRRG
jgi:flagellar biosynthesis/type III secretory pathway chaperone